MVVLLTGASGFLGRAVIRLLSVNHAVVALHRGTSPPPIPRVTWVRHDLVDPLPDLPYEIDSVVHLAQSGARHDFPAGAEDVTVLNVVSTVRLLDLCWQRGARLVLASSGAVYAPGPYPLREDDEPRPPSFYGDSKLAAERAVLRFSGLLDASILRFFFIYGPCQSSGFMVDLVDRVRTGRPVLLGGSDGLRLNPVFLADAASAVERALMGAAGDICNVAGPETMNLRTLAKMIGERVGRPPMFDSRPTGGDVVGSLELCRARLGLPTTGLSDGLDLLLGNEGSGAIR